MPVNWSDLSIERGASKLWRKLTFHSCPAVCTRRHKATDINKKFLGRRLASRLTLDTAAQRGDYGDVRVQGVGSDENGASGRATTESRFNSWTSFRYNRIRRSRSGKSGLFLDTITHMRWLLWSGMIRWNYSRKRELIVIRLPTRGGCDDIRGVCSDVEEVRNKIWRLCVAPPGRIMTSWAETVCAVRSYSWWSWQVTPRSG